MTDANKYLKNYNIKIRELLDMITEEFPNNDLIKTMHRRFRVALTSDRTLLITETGPDLFLHRKMISEGRWDDLVMMDWESDIMNKDKTLINDVNNQTLASMIYLLRNIWERYSQSEKEHVTGIIRKLLSSYVKWCIADQRKP